MSLNHCVILEARPTQFIVDSEILSNYSKERCAMNRVIFVAIVCNESNQLQLP